jgi:hypothetical protein
MAKCRANRLARQPLSDGHVAKHAHTHICSFVNPHVNAYAIRIIHQWILGIFRVVYRIGMVG